MSKRQSDLSRKKLSLLFLESLNRDQVSKELATLDENHQEIDSKIVLEHILHIDQEGMVDLIENIFFEIYVLHLIVLQNKILADTLHSEQLTGSLLLYEEHFSKSPLANQLLDLEIFESRIALLTRVHSFGAAGHRLTQLSVFVIVGLRRFKRGVIYLEGSDRLSLRIVVHRVLIRCILLRQCWRVQLD